MHKLNERPVCIYHANCLDGAAAAWVVWKFFNGEVDLIEGNYKSRVLPEGLEGREIYIVDFSYSAPVMRQLVDIAAKIVLIDHHASAERDLSELIEMIGSAKKNTTFLIDQNYSGAGLAWKYFMGSNPMPQAIRHVQDRDLWKFELPDTKAFCAAAFSHPLTVEAFDVLINQNIHDIIVEGTALLRKQENDIQRLLKNVHQIQLDEFTVPAVNANYQFASDIGSIMSKDNPFAVVYFDGSDGRSFSLRSRPKEGGEDVSLIAERFGGGGHDGSAGFAIPFDDPRYDKSALFLESIPKDTDGEEGGHQW